MPTLNLTPSSIDLPPYAGRWIALVRGRVAGVGLTPHEARWLAKAARPKEEPLIVFVPRSITDRMKR